MTLHRTLQAILPVALLSWIRSVRARRRSRSAFARRTQQYAEVGARTWDTEPEYCMSMLRMSAHILDKGLHAENWQRSRSKNAYANAKRLFAAVEGLQDSSRSWAGEVIEEYERRNAGEDVARERKRERKSGGRLAADQLLTHLQSRTSVRTFTRNNVSEEDVGRIVEAGLQAASSCHRQTLRVYGTVNPEFANEIGRCFQGFTCYSEFVPSLLVFCADLRPYDFPAELFTPTVDTALAVQNAVLYSHALGLSVTLLNWTNAPERESTLRRLLGIADHETIVVGAACGYPTSDTIRPNRKPVESTLTLR